jgi:hypothetical protein
LNGSILLACNYILNLLPTPLTLGDSKSASHWLWTGQANNEIDRLRVIRQPDISFGWRGLSRTRVGMIDGQKRFTAVAHLALRGEEIFGRRFVRNVRIGGNVVERVDAGNTAAYTANEATTFSGRGLFRARKNLIAMGSLEPDHLRRND